MKKEFTAIEAKNEAQKIAFAPILFQAIVSLRETGILSLIGKNKKGAQISEVVSQSGISEYGVRVLLEAAASASVVEFSDEDTVSLTTIGVMINMDSMTKVNFDFVNDVCYNGAKYTTESIKTGIPVGLKTLGNWNTLYEGLMQFPDHVKKSWLDFDHYYSDSAFLAALKIVFEKKPKIIFDIGGNTGKWALACCNYDSDVRVKILDLPVQLAIAKKNVELKQLNDRIDLHPINFLDKNQEIPKGADIIWMSQLLDCFSADEIISLLKNVLHASDDKTEIYILEPFIDNQKFDAATYCLTATSLYFTTMANGNSKMYSIKAMEKFIREAGLKVVESFPLLDESHQTLLKCRKA
ncbi:MAG: SAM-dependent methyltransferase [Bacteroidia bacterium]|nr:SAM-dependent methyltransferase [Bacteroidia bacterium]